MCEEHSRDSWKKERSKKPTYATHGKQGRDESTGVRIMSEQVRLGKQRKEIINTVGNKDIGWKRV